ncbi:MAG: hypothetical protein ISR67_06775 [Sulfurimonas sp.]|nr:hypothetical protein [Sulfurimonas sp.]
MNFYISISRLQLKAKRWVHLAIIYSLSISVLIFSFNYIIDPYALTQYNILNIEYKLARDDRATKVNFFKTQKTFDNIILGSSRVYSINPRIASEILGGTTYNFAVGSASVEDHLGTLKYLERENKLPRNLIIGLDFYTFNKDIPADKHFLKNKELNFFTYSHIINDTFNYELFFSINTLRASLKTIKHHFRSTGKKPNFDTMGWGGKYIEYKTLKPLIELEKVREEIKKNKKIFYTNYSYNTLDPKRLNYYQEIKKICKDNNIKLYIFSTPLHPLAIRELKENTNTNQAFNLFKIFVKSFKPSYNSFEDDEFQNNYNHFSGATHTRSNAGDIILKKLLLPKYNSLDL